MARNAKRYKNGMTLIEVMIAIVILMVVSLAVMQTALVGMNTNLQNSLRDEAVNVADQRMNELRNMPFDSIALGTHVEAGIVKASRASNVTYTPTRAITQINADMKQITMSIAWSYRGKNYTHSVTTIMRRP